MRLATALTSAIIAALVIILSGLLSGARYETVAFRTVIGFVVAGGIVYAVDLWLERYGFPAFFRKSQLEEGEPAAAKENGEGEKTTEEIPEEMQKDLSAEGMAAGDDFQPLSAEQLQRVSPPQE